MGVAGAVLVFVGVALFASVSLPWEGTLDTRYHIDYAYQVWLGHLPEPYGLVFDAEGAATSDDRQFASAHPPLMYLLAAAVMGPAFGANDWGMAVALGRALNMVFGVLCVLALAWAAWEIGGPWRRRLAIAVAVFGTLSVSFVRLSADFYNDILLTAIATASLALAIKVLRCGVSVWRIAGLSVLTSAGMLTKATYIFMLILVVGAIGVAAVIHRRGPAIRALAAGAVRAVPVVLAPLLASGWFYARNAALSGSWYRSTPKEQVGDRPYRTTRDALADPEFYLVVPDRMLGQIQVSWAWVTNWQASRVLVGALVLSALVWAGTRLVRRMRADQRSSVTAGAVWAMLLPIGLILGLYAAQLSHATGYGAFNYRYFLPGTFAIALVLALGALAWGRAARFLVPGVALVMIYGTWRYSEYLVVRRYTEIVGERTGLEAFIAAAADNGVSPALFWLALGLLLLGLIGVFLGLTAATRTSANDPTFEQWWGSDSSAGAASVPERTSRATHSP